MCERRGRITYAVLLSARGATKGDPVICVLSHYNDDDRGVGYHSPPRYTSHVSLSVDNSVHRAMHQAYVDSH